MPFLFDSSKVFRKTLRKVTKGLGGRYGQLPESLVWPVVQQVDSAGFEFQVLVWPGPTPALVLLHGLNNNAWSWARVASQLCKDRMVVAISQRGHGLSHSPDSGYGLEQTTRDLLGVLSALSLAPIDLGGHSWGGKVATHFACTHPECISSLILADPVPPQGLNPLLRAFPGLVRESFRVERGPFPNQEAWENAMNSVVYLQHGDEIDKNIWSGDFRCASDGSYEPVLSEAAFEEILTGPISENILPIASSCRAPVLFLRPTFTLSFFPGERRRMAQVFARLQTKRIAGDHSFMHTNPLDTARAMAEFLGK